MALATQSFEEILVELAASHVPVLLVGEPGVGKGIVARRIHENAPWCDAPFIECEGKGLGDAAIRSAFGPSVNGDSAPSTIYFDNIDALSASAQRSLLACIEARVGHSQWPRIIASAGSDIDMEVRTGRFREDLYYRISGICLAIPPLRYRKESIEAIADQYLEKYAREFNRPRPQMTAPLVRFLQSHPWMGNLHELEEAMRTIVAVGNVRVAISAIQSSAVTPTREKKSSSESVSLKQVARAASQRAERELILKVLSRTQWNRKRAAQELRISYKALLYKLKEINTSPGGQGGRDQ